MHLKIGKDLDFAHQLLEKGDCVAIPTETVYGLAANALNEQAVLKIFEIKNRPQFDPLIVHCANLKQAESLSSEFPKELKVLAEKFWPGPLTVVVKKAAIIPDLVTSGLDTVALRVPGHDLCLDLLYISDFPLAAPSANPFSYVSPTSAFHVLHQLGDSIEYILDGDNSIIGLESTIVRFHEGNIEILRQGGLSQEEIQEHSIVPVTEASQKGTNVPGNFKKHYSNAKPMELLASVADIPVLKEGEVVLHYEKPKADTLSGDQHKYLSEDGGYYEAAKNLFAMLRSLDKEEVTKIYAIKAPDQSLGRAINDRLERASAK